MNDGMKIILERLKTHPEEFTDDSNPFASEGKWTKLIHQYQHNLPKEDVDAFKQAIDEIRQAEFTAKVMEELLDPKPEEDDSLGKPWYNKQGSITLSAGQTQEQSTKIHELLHMKAQMDLEKHKAKQVQKTLVGKLKNYLHNE